MSEFKLSDLFNSDVVKAMADNAEALKYATGDHEEEILLKQDHSCSCCCPKFLKFKFFWSNVEINNFNAECKKEKEKDHKKDC